MRNTLRFGLALAFVITVGGGLAAAEELAVEFDNNSSHKVMELYIAEPGMLAEEPNILGDEPLQPGEIIEIGVAPDRSVCSYDVKYVLDDGLTSEDSGVDFCAKTTYLALGGTRVDADAACNVEKEGTEIGELYMAKFGGEVTPEAEAVGAKMMQAFTAYAEGKVDEACSIYDDIRVELGG